MRLRPALTGEVKWWALLAIGPSQPWLPWPSP